MALNFELVIIKLVSLRGFRFALQVLALLQFDYVLRVIERPSFLPELVLFLIRLLTKDY
jgi:hypothetical protein